jgi:hypothetical protein
VIGVSASASDLRIAEEFFELFKTPWEPAVPRRTYPVVLSTDGSIDELDASLFLLYGSCEHAADRAAAITTHQVIGPIDASFDGWTVPIFGRAATFEAAAAPVLRLGGRTLECRYRVGVRTVQRVGYDLFREARLLLTEGQPPLYAPTPTLELHIALLRRLLLEGGVSFVEVPARPDGYDFACCLTHDLDFFGVRRHSLDRTMAGFVARASVGTLTDLVRGRRPLTDGIRNWTALLSLPLVFLGLARDFWSPFQDYARVEGSRRSTFFVAPFKGHPGVSPRGVVERARALPYQASDIRAEAMRAAKRGSELAVHGIDAWSDQRAGRAEMAQVTALTGRQTTGVRMHWLYFEADAPRRLEAAGFEYDATCGYNDAVGYRAGTSQVFRLPGCERLVELPLSIMDTALFSRQRMGASYSEALARCAQIVAHAKRFGGTLVVNWHDRSLAPERLWGRFYRALIGEIARGNRVWFATAREVVEWFRWRRAIRFTWESGSGVVRVDAPAPPRGIPAGVLWTHRPARAPDAAAEQRRFDGHTPVGLAL